MSENLRRDIACIIETLAIQVALTDSNARYAIKINNYRYERSGNKFEEKRKETCYKINVCTAREACM